MFRAFLTATMISCIVAISATAIAQQGGTAQEARAMLDKAVAVVKADRDLALAMFNKGEGGFSDRDLYPYCFRISDGKALASPLAVPASTDVRTLKVSNGKAFGLELYAAAQKPEGEITEVTNMFPKPGTIAPAFPKVGFATKTGDLVCGVGYYK
jgi:hypothetical protein